MRKILAILIMLLVCSVYILSLNKEAISEDKSQQELVEGQSVLGNLREILTDNYPKTPKEVVEVNNQIMMYQYSNEIEVEEVEEVVELIRLLYTADLNALNDKNQQVQHLKEEIILNMGNDFCLKESSIEAINFTHENIAEVHVRYVTSQSEITRIYTVMREDEKWKIHNWY